MTVFLVLVDKQVECLYNVRVVQDFKVFVLAFEHADELTVSAPETFHSVHFSS